MMASIIEANCSVGHSPRLCFDFVGSIGGTSAVDFKHGHFSVDRLILPNLSGFG